MFKSGEIKARRWRHASRARRSSRHPDGSYARANIAGITLSSTGAIRTRESPRGCGPWETSLLGVTLYRARYATSSLFQSARDMTTRAKPEQAFHVNALGVGVDGHCGKPDQRNVFRSIYREILAENGRTFGPFPKAKKGQREPAVRIPFAPPTRHCEAPVRLRESEHAARSRQESRVRTRKGRALGARSDLIKQPTWGRSGQDFKLGHTTCPRFKPRMSGSA